MDGSPVDRDPAGAALTGGDSDRWAGPAFAAVVLLSLYVLFWPSPAGSSVTLPGVDKLVHAALFLLLALTARVRFGVAAPVLAAVLAYAALSELVQAGLLRERSGDLLDVVADGLGALLGWELARRWALRTPARRPGPRPGA